MFARKLSLDLPAGQSAFLWGARQTGKSSYLRQHFADAVYYDLLDTHQVVQLTKTPSLLRETVSAKVANGLSQPVIIDEIQKIPDLLNEVHWLIENKQVPFILCGSSARKLKTQSTNLLGGRAWPFYFYPLIAHEIPEFDLLRALQHGLIPNHYLAETKYIGNHLQAYVDVYLTDEIRNEGLVRNLPGFARFLDVAGLCNGQMINASNVARDCAIDRQTVQGYYQILVDTLLGYYLYPYQKKVKRDVVTATPKFYLFDVGVANYLAKQVVSSLSGAVAGGAFEHFIMMELQAYRGLNRKRFDITYWRTKTGLEVDFILGDAEVAVEVKLAEQVHKENLAGLIAFKEEHPSCEALVVCQCVQPRDIDLGDGAVIHVLPWQDFLQRLWQGVWV